MGETAIVSHIQKGGDMPDTNNKFYFTETKTKAVFTGDGPKPQFLFDTPGFKTLVVGLEPGQQIPLHPEEAAMYHFSNTG
jgi:hypothetical protein